MGINALQIFSVVQMKTKRTKENKINCIMVGYVASLKTKVYNFAADFFLQPPPPTS
jgi:hypothetical protein